MLSWEKPLVKPMALGSIFHHINLPPTSYFCRRLFCNLYFSIYTTKIPKIFILLSLSDLTFASDREGIDNPFIALVARFLFVCVGTRQLVCSLLLDWYLGSQKLREILTLLCCITLSSSRENQRSAQEVAVAKGLPPRTAAGASAAFVLFFFSILHQEWNQYGPGGACIELWFLNHFAMFVVSVLCRYFVQR